MVSLSDKSDFAPYAMTNKELTERVTRRVELTSWINAKEVDDEIELSEDISHFNLISFCLGLNDANNGVQAVTFPYNANALYEYIYLYFYYSDGMKYIRLKRISNTKFKVVGTDLPSGTAYGVRQIIGIV